MINASWLNRVGFIDGTRSRIDEPVLEGMSPRERAIARGDKRYLPGDPCAKGHLSERWASTNCCVMCKRESQRRRKAAAKVLGKRC